MTNMSIRLRLICQLSIVCLSLTANAQKAELVLETGHTSSVHSVAFSPDGRFFASGEIFSNTELWETKSGLEMRTFAGGEPVFSPDGRTLATFTGQNFRLWNWQTGEELFANQTFTSIGSAGSAAFSPKGDALAITSYSPDLIKLFDVQSGKVLRSLAGHTDLIETVTFSPDGKILASSSADKTIKLWDWHSGEQVRTIQAYTGFSLFSPSLVFSPDGKIIAASVVSNGIKLWDVKTGQESLTIPGADLQFDASLMFSPDGKILAMGGFNLQSGRGFQLRDAQTGKELWTIPIESGLRPDAIYCPVAFSPDGKLLVTGGDSKPILWDLATRKKLRETVGSVSKVMSVVLSADGSVLASGSLTGAIRLWSLRKGLPFQTLAGHAFSVEALAFSEDGKVLASSYADKTIKLWDIQTGKELKSLSIKEPDTQKQIEAIVPSFYRANQKPYAIAAGTFNILWSDDGRINIHEENNPKPSASLISLNENDWAVVTPDGLFDASDGARRFMHYITGLNPVALEQMKDSYYVPGLLQKVFEGRPLPKVELFSKRDLFPEVQYEPFRPGQRQLTVKLTNRGGGIGQIQVLINGKELISDARSAGFDPNSANVTIKIDLSNAAVKVGENNRIEVVARNASGSLSNRGTDEAEMVYKDGGKSSTDSPGIYAIIGGISDYTDARLRLSFAAKDAEDFAHAFDLGAVKLLNGDRSKVHIRLLTSNGGKSTTRFTAADAKASTATKASFAKAFSDFRAATPSDVFIVYLAGHGISLASNQNSNQTDGDAYLYLTQEATTTDKTVLALESSRRAMAISSDELKDLMKQNNALKQVLILDTCAAGAFSKAMGGAREVPTDQIRAIERLKDGTGFFVLMGAAADATSYEASQYGQGLLTYALLQGMKGARLRQNQFADIAMLFGYAQETVPQMAKNISGIQQPVIVIPYTSNSFDIGRFTPEEQELISLATLKPLVLLPRLRNSARRFDDLKLSQIMTEQLREINYSQRGGQQGGVVFVEADDMTDAIRPEGDYSVEGETLKISVILVKNSAAQGKEITVMGNVNQPEKVVKQLTEAVLQALPREEQ